MDLKQYQDTAKFLYKTQLRYFIPQVFSFIEPETHFDRCWYHDYMAYCLQRTLPVTPSVDGLILNPTPEERIRNLVINIPPRHLKSRYANAFKAFLLGNYPWEKIISSSYSYKLSGKLNAETRKMLTDPIFQECFPKTKVDKDAEALFTTTEGGASMATSTGGTATGFGANFIVIDDPLNPQESKSDIERVKCNEWYQNTLFNRGNSPKTVVKILIMQRLHEEDLAGLILSMNKNLAPEHRWVHVNLPVVSKATRTYYYYDQEYTWKEGDILTPDRYNENDINNWKTELGSMAFAGQFLQEPAPSEGGIIKVNWFNRYDFRSTPNPKERLYRIMSVDTANKIGIKNDRSACLTFDHMKTHKDFLIDHWAEKLDYIDLKARIIDQATSLSPDIILIEDKASGQQLIQELRATTNLPIVAVNPTQDKETRMVAASPYIEAGHIFFPTAASNPSITDLELELAYFPNGKYKDRVDALSQYVNYIRKKASKAIRITTFGDGGVKSYLPLNPLVDVNTTK